MKVITWDSGVKQPADKGIILKDILTEDKDQFIFLSQKEIDRALDKHKVKYYPSGNRRGNMKFPDDINKKTKCLCSVRIKGARETHHVQSNKGIRMLTLVECERLQTLPDNYTKGISITARYKILGNCFTVDIIVHILRSVLK